MKPKYMLLWGASLVLASCGNEQNSETYATEHVPVTEQRQAHKTAEDTSAKMIKRADIACEVPDVLAQTMSLERMTKEMGGYVQSSAITNNPGYADAKVDMGDSVKIYRENHISADLVLQIPSDKLDSVINTIPGNATAVLRRQISQQDASLDFLANEWRLQAATETGEGRKDAAHAKHPPTTERLIAAKVQNLSIMKRVSFSSVSIHLSQPPVISSTTQLNISSISRPTFLASLSTGLQSGTQALQSLIVAMAYIWPLLFAVSAALAIVYFIRRKITATAK